ncbi:MAG: endonuclease/exonuclease/phosphatase [Planctomycetaceae bacterium]|nr:endonuclease/exonuclease/phosphatase [Planctomycetaceae bacterium]
MRRRFGDLVYLAVLAVLLVGCNGEQAKQALGKLAERAARTQTEQSAPDGPAPPALPPAIEGDRPVRIATFNIQVFGTSKLAKPEVMGVLADVVRRFDVVAIQEIRSTDQTVVPQFVQLVNSQGAQYHFVIGPRLGRTSSKEQYAFIYDTTRIAVDPNTVYTVGDPADYLHREPLVAHFQVRVPQGQVPFTFKLANIHTDPDETDMELDALDDVFVAVQRDGSGEDDVILLGDLNVDEYHLGQLGQLPEIAWVVTGTTTNTRRTQAYDNIVLNRSTTTEYTGRWGVLDLEREYGLTRDQVLGVSDHLPVWAEFSPVELSPAGPIAARPAVAR